MDVTVVADNRPGKEVRGHRGWPTSGLRDATSSWDCLQCPGSLLNWRMVSPVARCSVWALVEDGLLASEEKQAGGQEAVQHVDQEARVFLRVPQLMVWAEAGPEPRSRVGGIFLFGGIFTTLHRATGPLRALVLASQGERHFLTLQQAEQRGSIHVPLVVDSRREGGTETS